jgi:hypothetical protein
MSMTHITKAKVINHIMIINKYRMTDFFGWDTQINCIFNHITHIVYIQQKIVGREHFPQQRQRKQQ